MAVWPLTAGVRLTANYSAFGRRASMVFHFRTPDGSEPSVPGCQSVARGYREWENDGLGFGYTILRGDDSHFVGLTVTSLLGPGHATWRETGIDETGQIPGFISAMLPTGVAPIVRWATSERGPATGRTYLVGVSSGATAFGADQSYLGGGAGALIGEVVGNLLSVVRSRSGYVMVHRTSSGRGGLGIGPKLLDITGSGVYNLVGSRRLRTRPGR